jgi:PEGA domain
MRRLTYVLCVITLLLLNPANFAQETSKTADSNSPQPVPQTPTTVAQTPKAAPTKPTLEDGTPVKIRISQTVSSADAHVGQTVDFEVLEEVKLGDTLIIPKGGIAWATVTEAQSKRRMGRGGKLNINIDTVRLVDGEKVALRAVKDMKGGGHVGAMTGAIVATSIVFFPAAPLFLFMHGKDITIPKGTEITAYINGDVPLDVAKFQPQTPAPAASPAAAPVSANLDFTSDPTGADIELDGNFVGSTPSSLSIEPGEHTIRIIKAGFKTWERKMKTAAGNVKIAAQLETQPTDVPQAK